MSQSYKEQVEALPNGVSDHEWAGYRDFILGFSAARAAGARIASDADAALAAAREERDALRAECEALRKDAERYRAIRMRQWELDGAFTVNLVCLPHANQSLAMYFDDAVDAALAAIAERARETDHSA